VTGRMEPAASLSPKSPERDIDRAAELMLAFAARTGLRGASSPRRYLWTDAFAVTNFFGLAAVTGDEQYAELALRLIDDVHRVLGRHRPDDRRTGWLSGLADDEARQHPTRGGLRIGKPLPERGVAERRDERAEWDRDGQYFHYLTKWMHALDQAARATAEPRFNDWARELADVAHAAFVRHGEGQLQIAWKMSIDLSRRLVRAMGMHDPLDGLVTAAELDATARLLAGGEPRLSRAAEDYAAMVEEGVLPTADPLGIGGLLMDAARVAQLVERSDLMHGELLDALLGAAHTGLFHCLRSGELARPAGARLAFRELGLAIGLRACALVGCAGPLEPYLSLAETLASFWVEPRRRDDAAWREHQDINEVMLATCLAPEGFVLFSPRA
jgi:hypothetical protein